MKESKNKAAHPSMRGGPSSGGTQPNALVVEFLTALGHALAAATLNVMRAGCQPPTWDEVLARLAAHPVRLAAGVH